MVLIALFTLSLLLNFYLIFHETLNKIQYVGLIRLYWITRDTGEFTDPHIRKAFMRQTMPPFWRGKGIEVRFRQYTFQVGILVRKADTLLDQLDGRHLDNNAKSIRGWGNEDQS